MPPDALTEEELLGRLTAETELLVAAAYKAGWDTPVPGLEWDVRAVVTHTGAVHRWCADIVRRALPTNETGGSSAFLPAELTDEHRGGWVAEGVEPLVDALRAAPDDLGCYAFLRDVPARHFWARRQAHETAMHRADVEAAAGAVTPFDADFAQDGLVEIVGGFARQRPFAVAEAATLALVASDGPGWYVTFGGERTVVDRTVIERTVDATVSGTSSELYLWAWNRPSPVTITGDARVAAMWRVRI